jgi:hypothetical protein
MVEDELHQSPHTLFATGKEGGYDFVVAQAGGEWFRRNCQLA